MIDTSYRRSAPWGERWEVRVLSTGEVLYRFRWKSTAAAVGEAVAVERGMTHWIRNRNGHVVERHKYNRVQSEGLGGQGDEGYIRIREIIPE